VPIRATYDFILDADDVIRISRGNWVANKTGTDLSKCSVCIVDDDKTSLPILRSCLQDLGVSQVVECDDGDKGWEKIRTGNFSIIIMEWNLSKTSGIALFNRIRRSERTALTPVLVITSNLNKQDFALLSEYPCSVFAAKPVSRPEFDNQVNAVMDEFESYRTNLELIENLLDSIKYDAAAAEKMMDKLWGKLPNPLPVAIMAAKLLRENMVLDVAERVLRKCMEYSHKMIPIVTELGKVLHLQGKLQEATRVLHHAQNFSPRSVDRLMLLGEIHLQQTEPEKAREYFASVMEIDPRDRKARHGELTATNLSEHIAGAGRSDKLTGSFASMLNILAINLVRNKRHADGIKQYEAAMSFAANDSIAAKVAFNIGMGFMRWSKHEKAMTWFQKAASVDGPCAAKARKYIEEIERKNGKMHLKFEPLVIGDDKNQETAEVAIEDGVTKIFDKNAKGKLVTGDVEIDSEGVDEIAV